MSRYLVVLPDDSVQPILSAIDQAEISLRIKMFVFSDRRVIDAVIRAHRRGVRVRIMLNPTRRNGKTENEDSRRQLGQAGIEVIDSTPAFEVTHEKSMVVDENSAWIMSPELGNEKSDGDPRLCRRYVPQTRGERDHGVF